MLRASLSCRRLGLCVSGDEAAVDHPAEHDGLYERRAKIGVAVAEVEGLIDLVEVGEGEAAELFIEVSGEVRRE